MSAQGVGGDGAAVDPFTVRALTERLRAAARDADGSRSPQEADLEARTLNQLTAMNNELTDLQRELVARNAELDGINEWKDHVLGMVAHDLRGPLTAIRGFAELLSHVLAKDISEQQMDMVQQIVRSSDRLGGMIDDLLDAGALRAGQMRVDLQDDADVVAAVRYAVDELRPMAGDKNVHIQMRADEEPVWWAVDPPKLGQMVTNLVSNAIKYSPMDTTVLVECVVDEVDLVLRVTDQGPGMGEADLALLFKPYGVTSVRATGGEKSLGLGLMIVKAIAAGHGGTVGVISEVGVGSTFEVRLPPPAPKA